ncbi:hypothetical protein ABMY44_03950 [Pseudoalteromonas sp. Cnat2-41]|uniref:hypothetical protein n=1 Tax=unclassified Pseudoalteromonas TaxID=194690 RepID=UPI001EF76A03|nr:MULTISPECIES: hypothetical protein [unclassified Pseudoalteromonas]MCF2861314.1 hypothetical protein [Pseudoalteromonas sp. CNAT2-18]MCG7557647.1 hypothetical protein [Pseudoalteromonas sp. CNAT2-18.1]
MDESTLNNFEREDLIKTSWELHSLVEANYLANPVTKDDKEWLEKQRVLLADMAIHLLQTAINPGNLELDKLRNNIHSILTISDQFLPKADLKKATEKLYE